MFSIRTNGWLLGIAGPYQTSEDDCGSYEWGMLRRYWNIWVSLGQASKIDISFFLCPFKGHVNLWWCKKFWGGYYVTNVLIMQTKGGEHSLSKLSLVVIYFFQPVSFSLYR